MADYCLVPGCDEQPFPGDDMCLTHQREDLAREDLANRFLNEPCGRCGDPTCFGACEVDADQKGPKVHG